MPQNYIYENGELLSEDELMHYGVLGMKWGVRRANKKMEQNLKLKNKALKYDVKSSKYSKKSEKIHNKLDLENATKKAVKAAKYEVKSKQLAKRANKETDAHNALKLQRKSEKYAYKSKKLKIDANTISKVKGYSARAMKYSIKSDIVAKKAARARLKIANNKLYIDNMNRKISSFS